MRCLRSAFWALLTVCLLAAPGHAQETEECPNPKGWRPTPDELQNILRAHSDWWDADGYQDPTIPGKANLCMADLIGADLFGADLFGADLIGADLREADLREADLCGADLIGAYLREADLFEADLSGADLSGADLSGSNLSGAKLSGDNLRLAKNLISDQLNTACGDDKTQLPDGLSGVKLEACAER